MSEISVSPSSEAYGIGLKLYVKSMIASSDKRRQQVGYRFKRKIGCWSAQHPYGVYIGLAVMDVKDPEVTMSGRTYLGLGFNETNGIKYKVTIAFITKVNAIRDDFLDDHP